MSRDSAVEAAEDALDIASECSCADDPDAQCWYHMSTREQIEYAAEIAVGAARRTIAREIEAQFIPNARDIGWDAQYLNDGLALAARIAWGES